MKKLFCFLSIVVWFSPFMSFSETDMDQLLKRAQQGDAPSQVELGDCYLDGKDVPTNIVEAVKWYRLAAAQENVLAQRHLGYCYREGSGVELNLETSAGWYRRAAENGDAVAQYILGVSYYAGQGVAQDYKEAARWCRLSAEQGYAEAQSNLGACYHNGRGVLQDYVEAYAWWLIAAMNGSNLGAENRDVYKNSMGGEQIAAGQARAKELIANIERKKKLSTVSFGQVLSGDIDPSGYGSGLLIEGGYVVTCWHVVENAKKIFINYLGKDFSASVAQKDTGNDLAILRVDGVDAGASLSFANSVKLGEQVFTMGFPHPDLQGSNVKFTTGTISGLTGAQDTPLYYQISVPTQAGNSGGPLFDKYGNLAGIVAAKLNSPVTLADTGDLTQNVNYAIKSDYLVPLMKTVDGIKVRPYQTKSVNLLALVEELKKSVVMIKVY